jgi:hypothetical protein
VSRPLTAEDIAFVKSLVIYEDELLLAFCCSPSTNRQAYPARRGVRPAPPSTT